MGLLDAFIQYAKDAMPGGLLNAETQPVVDRAKYIGGLLDPNSQVSQDARNWHGKVQTGLKDQLAGLQTPAADYAHSQMMNMAGIAPLGMIAWHGSPHKFDKFDLSKIGTGEGAQAYGHGLYLAESPAVAKEYSKMSAEVTPPPNRIFQGVELVPGTPEYHAGTLLERSTLPAARKEVAGWIAEGHPDPKVLDGWRVTLDTLNKATKKSDFKVGKNENLYKTDIPDEAVARFLDWDKPLSQQAPEVVSALERSKNKNLRSMIDYAKTPYSEAIGGEEKTMGEAFRLLNLNLQGKSSADSVKASALLAKQGIPGIRYLDGGSRSAGNGTSNFVAFDPEMIRILERNGQPTGLQPWKPGEYKGLLAP